MVLETLRLQEGLFLSITCPLHNLHKLRGREGGVPSGTDEYLWEQVSGCPLGCKMVPLALNSLTALLVSIF